MWHFHLFGLKADLWTHSPPQAAVRILQGVLSGSLDTLTSYYITITPSKQRIPQYK